MKKIKPTPKSITHKNPIQISASFSNNEIPANIKYKPDVYNRIRILEDIKNALKKKLDVTNEYMKYIDDSKKLID